MTRTSCNCDRCRGACHSSPGWFLPGEAERAAEFLGLSFEDFFQKYLVVEHRGENAVWCLVLAPAVTWQTNTVAARTDVFKPGTCRLLGHSGCLLDLEHRPHECAIYQGCVKRASWRTRGRIAGVWRRAKVQPMLRALGRLKRKESGPPAPYRPNDMFVEERVNPFALESLPAFTPYSPMLD